MISSLINIPFLGILLLLIIPDNNSILIRQIAFLASSIAFIYSLVLWVFFDNSTSNFQYVEFFDWGVLFNVSFFFGVDGMSLFFVILSTLLTSICILNSWSTIKKQIKAYMICFLLIESFLIIVFSVLDIIIFYIFPFFLRPS